MDATKSKSCHIFVDLILIKLLRKIIALLVYPFKKRSRVVTYTMKELSRNVLRPCELNKYIFSLIQSGIPFMVGRLGSCELRHIVKYDYESSLTFPQKLVEWSFSSSWPLSSSNYTELLQTAGFYPIDIPGIQRFVEIYKTSMYNVDILASWLSQESLYSQYLSRSRICTLQSIEPYFWDNPWTKALEGKKVLVVHPFAETIYHQYTKNRLHLFPGKDILPSFTLIVLQAYLTTGFHTCPHKNWFEALDSLFEKAMKLNFDIAIIGCGAYGFPLASMIKSAGRQAVHLGGCTQILFGIRGKRWDNHPKIRSFFNTYWTRPNIFERPNNYSDIEDGCYW